MYYLFFINILNSGLCKSALLEIKSVSGKNICSGQPWLLAAGDHPNIDSVTVALRGIVYVGTGKKSREHACEFVFQQLQITSLCRALNLLAFQFTALQK